MGRTRYDEARKAEAVELAVAHGKAEAARRTGIPAGTIGSWCSRAGLATVATERTAAATEANRQRWEERRSELVHRIGEIAEKALDEVNAQLDDGKLRNAKDAATTMAILVDKAQLLSGGSTVRFGSDADRAKVLSAAHREGLSLVSDAA